MRRFTNLVREGRFRAPAASALVLGTLVQIDASDTDRIEQADASADGVGIGGSKSVATDLCGILWYEHDSQTLVGQGEPFLAQDQDTAPAGRMVQVLHGPGTKVWLRNTAANTAEPGLNYTPVRAAVSMFAGTPAVNDLLGWHPANAEWTITTDATEAFLRVTALDTNGTGSLDAELLY